MLFISGCLYFVRYWTISRLWRHRFWNNNLIFLIKSLFLHDQKFKTKILVSSKRKELLRWNKIYFSSFLKRFHWSKSFLEGESPTGWCSCINKLKNPVRPERADYMLFRGETESLFDFCNAMEYCAKYASSLIRIMDSNVA